MGLALVAWMMLFTHFVWLAALHVIGCGPDGDELQRVLLGLAPVTCVFAYLVGVTRPFADIHSMLGWLRAPLGILMVLALRSIWGAANRVNVDGLAFCGPGAPAAWEKYWSPAQLAVLLLVAILVIRQMKRSH
jgi:hypothetical protein